MMTDQWFIRTIDHRISSALIFFFLLHLLGKNKRPLFPVRALVSLAGMCFVSWGIRTVVDVCLNSALWIGAGYGVYLLALSLMFMFSHWLCYESTLAELVYLDLLALTIYKLAWNTFKVFAAGGKLLVNTHQPWSTYSITGALVSYCVYALVCAFTCRLHQRIVPSIPNASSPRPMLLTHGAFLLCQIVLEFCGHVLTADTSSLFLYYMCALLYTLSTYVVILSIGRLIYYRRSSEDMQNFIRNKIQYYHMSREGITSLQIKCHDLKHQIAVIRTHMEKENFSKYLDRLEDSIIEYGTVVECGNEPLNVVLTEKNILCSTYGVKFSYILDGSLFDFMSEMEIYSLFGNALDNALESCSKVEDPLKRVIALKAAVRGDMVVLHVENAYQTAPTMVGGIPQTTKKDPGHGFGLRSIQSIAEKYDGFLSVQAEDHLFKLTVVMRPRAVNA